MEPCLPRSSKNTRTDDLVAWVEGPSHYGGKTFLRMRGIGFVCKKRGVGSLGKGSSRQVYVKGELEKPIRDTSPGLALPRGPVHTYFSTRYLRDGGLRRKTCLCQLSSLFHVVHAFPITEGNCTSPWRDERGVSGTERFRSGG